MKIGKMKKESNEKKVEMKKERNEIWVKWKKSQMKISEMKKKAMRIYLINNDVDNRYPVYHRF